MHIFSCYLRTFTYLHVYKTYLDVYMHTHTYIITHMNIYIHTYIYILTSYGNFPSQCPSKGFIQSWTIVFKKYAGIDCVLRIGMYVCMYVCMYVHVE